MKSIKGKADPYRLLLLVLVPLSFILAVVGCGSGSRGGVNLSSPSQPTKDTYAHVNAANGLVIRNSPSGKPIGKLGNGERVGLTGVEQSSNGQTWSETTSGGWVVKDDLSFN